MITQTLLDQALQENAPHLLLEELLSSTWLHPQPPIMTSQVFASNEQKLLDKALNEKPLSWWRSIWDVEPSTSWRSTLNKLLVNCGVKYSSNPQWLEVWSKDSQTPQDAYQLAYQCVVENNITLLDVLCRQPLLRSHPHLYNRLFKDSVRKKCLNAFVYLSSRIQNRNTPEVVGAVIKECVQLNFLSGLQHVLENTSKKTLRQTYQTCDDFSQLRLAKNYMENDSFVALLTEGGLQDHIKKDVWVKVSKDYLNGMFALYMADIMVFRLSARVYPAVEEVFFNHKHWNGVRMEWLVQTMKSSPTSQMLSSSVKTMQTKWINILLPATTPHERKLWLDQNQNVRSCEALYPLFNHPLMQETLLRYELKDEMDKKDATPLRKI